MFFIPSIFVIIIFILLHSNGYVTKILESKPLQFLGKISYALYLNHWIVFMIIFKPIFDLPGGHYSEISQLLIFVFTTLIIIIYSYGTYFFIEHKFGRFLRDKYISH